MQTPRTHPTYWGGCIRYDIHIGAEQYQKCKFNSFQFNVNSESIPFLLELLKSELKERRVA